VENDLYWHDSNDGRNDFYDSEVWKITGSASGSVTPKLYLSGCFAFERKNYKERPVTGLVAPARYDDKYTLSSSASYDLNKTWKCAYALTFDHLASNESTGEFDNTKHALTVTARF
jgi:long-subunit fatty acid transport protein